MSLHDTRVGEFSIHSEQSLKFMRNLAPDPQVLEWMENGLRLPFTRAPAEYFEDNNKSCKENLEVARKKVRQWVEKGFVTEVKNRPHCCNPLSVSSRVDYLTGEEKFRPCLDLSRHVNPLLKVPEIKLEDLTVSEKLIQRNDFQVSWDLENCYFHVALAPEDRKYYGFSLPDLSGRPRFYQFNVMIYGLNIAAFVVTTLTKPLMAHLHKRGIRATIFIDDGRIVSSTSEEAWSHLKYALSTFEAAGWNIQHAKTSTCPVQKIYHMGYWCDSVTMTYSISEFKMRHIEEQIEKILHSPSWRLKDLAKIAGKCMAVVRAIGSMIPVMLRTTFILLAEEVTIGDINPYNKYVEPRPVVIRDLKFLMENLRRYEGQPVITDRVGYCLNRAIEEGDVIKAGKELGSGEDLWVSDSSNIKAVAYNVNRVGDEISIHEFSVSERELSSSARELIAVEVALKRLAAKIKEAGVYNIYWVTDSRVLTVWLQKGTKIPSVQERIVGIFRILHSIEAQIIPIWSPRENKLITMADECSKFRDSDDWGIDMKAIKVLENIFGQTFTCDMFANATNRRMNKFYSKVAAPGTSGINCFIQDWSTEYCYVCPPVNLIIDAVRYIERVPSRGVLLVPYWQRNPFWPVVTIDGFHLRPLFQKFHEFYPKIVTGQDLDSSAFRQGTRKRMLALEFDTKRKESSHIQDRCLLGKCGICSVK